MIFLNNPIFIFTEYNKIINFHKLDNTILWCKDFIQRNKCAFKLSLYKLTKSKWIDIEIKIIVDLKM